MAMLTYKGYAGALEVDVEAGELHGRTVGTADVITFHGRTVEEARRSFEESVDFYLEICAEQGKEPDRPYSGRFNVRLAPSLHRRLVVLAESRGQSLNDYVAGALAAAAGKSTERAKAPDPDWREVKADLLARKREAEAEASRGPAARPAREARARQPRARATGAK